ncbi:ParB/RepB/Spo0J family partition protein [Oribacterium sp. HCP28S3_H8]|uniref:ParB/RepB/Spo0J family partition protein n=1 Tax=Oribacterium sp. HCP28S3_H8 TaxID=3438945 RepID=UPI003F8A1DD6
MPKRGNISLSSYDDIFRTDESRAEEALEKVQPVAIDKLVPFKNHPFKVVDDEAMLRTTESIAQYGVLTPLIARPLDDGTFEIISGHRRAHAALAAGLTEVPVLVRQMDDDAATVLMVDSNLQRENILPSERAFAFKMKLEALNHQGSRSDLTSVQVAPKLSTEIIGESAGMSKDNVKRYIRLTSLIPSILDMVDQKQISFNPAVELSYLKPEEQEIFLEAMDEAQAAPSLSQAQRLKKLSQDGNFSLDTAREIMNEVKKGDLERVTFRNEQLRKYFPRSYTTQQMQDTIIRLLDQWQKKKSRGQEH